MPNRWKVVIGTLIVFVWAAAYTLWDLLDKTAAMAVPMPLHDTAWAPADIKQVWIPGVATALAFVVALVGDALDKKPPAKKKPSK